MKHEEKSQKSLYLSNATWDWRHDVSSPCILDGEENVALRKEEKEEKKVENAFSGKFAIIDFT
jgi:hypothetical protein